MSRWNPQPAIERAFDKLDVGDCWEFTGSLVTKGYGQIRGDDGPLVLVHRLVYEYLVGPIPPGMQLDHLCRNRRCCNPDHLEPVTNRANVLRGWRFRKAAA
jgi:hypothetical protein